MDKKSKVISNLIWRFFERFGAQAQGRTVRTPHLFPVDLSGDNLRVITE